MYQTQQPISTKSDGQMKSVEEVIQANKLNQSNQSKLYGTGLTKTDLANYWQTMREATSYRGVFAEPIPPSGWERQLSKLTLQQLRKSFERYLDEAPQFPPDLPTVLDWARNPKPNKYGSSQAAYNNDVSTQKRIEAKHASKETRDFYMEQIKEKLK